LIAHFIWDGNKYSHSIGPTKNNAKFFVYQITNFFKQNIKKSFPLHEKLLNILVTPNLVQLEKLRKLQALTKLFVLLLKTP
jgi:hypothetical protein